MNAEKKVLLRAGEFFITQEPVILCSNLRSGLALCLFAPETVLGGMAYFELPSREIVSSFPGMRLPEVAQFGDKIIPHFIEQFSLRHRIRTHHLKAKIVGGADIKEMQYPIPHLGHLNITLTKKILEAAGIEIIGEDIGGTELRQVIFFPQTGRLRVGKIENESSAESKESRPKEEALPIRSKKIKVMVVDDSKTVRHLIKAILEEDPAFEIIGEASHPLEATPLIEKLAPDCITLDIHMPHMDGVTYLEKLLPLHPLPVVMISSLGREDGDFVFKALELGAVDYIQKPKKDDLSDVADLIREKLKAAAKVNIKSRLKLKTLINPKKAMPTKEGVDSFKSRTSQHTILAIGASTGGTEAIKTILTQLPPTIPPIVIVQHIPAGFSAAFAQRLDQLCSFQVKEASDGDILEKGLVLIAPGGKQMEVVPASLPGQYCVHITDSPPVNRHKPSVDVLFSSMANQLGKRAVGMLLTGMGKDGAQGLLEMKKTGAHTLAQNQDSCVVFGMPREAIEIGAADEVCDLEEMAPRIVNLFGFS